MKTGGIGEEDAAVCVNVEVVAYFAAVLLNEACEGGEVIGNRPRRLEY